MQVKKTRTTALRPQSNALVKRMYWRFQSIIAKCIKGEQSHWPQQLPYVRMAYRTSVHESTGRTPLFLVYRQEVSIAHCLHVSKPERSTSSKHLWISVCPTNWSSNGVPFRPIQPSILIKYEDPLFTTGKSMDPPIKSIEKVYYKTLSFQSVTHQSFSAPENGRTSLYKASLMWLIEFRKSQSKQNLLFILTVSNRSNNRHRHRTSPRVIGELF